VNDEVVRTLGRIWLDYARYLEERRKFVSAQNVYLRALTERDPSDVSRNPEGGIVTDPADRELLWQEFLRMMQQRKNNPGLTLEKLKAAVIEEHLGGDPVSSVTMHSQSVTLPPQVVSSSFPMPPNTSFSAGYPSYPPPPISDLGRPLKRPKTEDAVMDEPEDKVALGKRVEEEAKQLTQMLSSIPADLQAAWMANDGNASPYRPLMLFGPSPPKLSDASGSDILGPELAMELVTILLRNTQLGSKGLAGKAVLQICKACWIMIGLKEKEASKALADLEKKLVSIHDSGVL